MVLPKYHQLEVSIKMARVIWKESFFIGQIGAEKRLEALKDVFVLMEDSGKDLNRSLEK
tara:strand:- start:760 stop:936 length:177 start_codon:yes stop_codon:yes gene_type:complete